MIQLVNTVKSWGTPDCEAILKEELQAIDPDLLPLQKGLSQSSYVSDSPINVVILNVTDTSNTIHAKTGIFYAGIIAGSCCADDPTPLTEQTEYCEVMFDIDKETGEARVSLLNT